MRKHLLILMVFSLMAGGMATEAWSGELGTATVKELAGEAKYKKAGDEQWLPLELDTVLSEGDSVKTGLDSQVKLELSGSGKIGEVTVRRESEFTLKALVHDPATGTRNTLLDVHVGSVLVQAEKLQGESKFRVKTPTSIVGVRGTKFEVNVRKK